MSVSNRTWIIEADPEGGQANRAALLQLLTELECTLFHVGGSLRVVADREPVGTAGGEKLYSTIGYVVQWQAFAPARHVEEPEPASA